MSPETSLDTGYKASHPKMPFEKKSYGLLKTFSFFSSPAGRVDFVCFQAFRPNKVPFYNFFIAGRSALKKKRCSNQCNSRPISTTGYQQMCRDDDKTSPKKGYAHQITYFPAQPISYLDNENTMPLPRTISWYRNCYIF